MAPVPRWEQTWDAASPVEVRLLEATLDTIAVAHPHRPGRPRKRPDRLIADRGYDSHATWALLVRHGRGPVIPARAENQRATYQDRRQLRRYRRGWIVERTIG